MMIYDDDLYFRIVTLVTPSSVRTEYVTLNLYQNHSLKIICSVHSILLLKHLMCI